MSNIQVGSLAIWLLLNILSCLVCVGAQNSNGGPFSPAHATDYGYGGHVGPLTYNGHVMPDTLSDAATSGRLDSAQLQTNPGQLQNPGQQPNTGQQPSNVRPPCSSTSTAQKPCSSSKKRCWLVSSGKGSVQLGPTQQHPGKSTLPGHHLGQGIVLGAGGTGGTGGAVGTVGTGGAVGTGGMSTGFGQYPSLKIGQYGSTGLGHTQVPSAVGVGSSFGTIGQAGPQSLHSTAEEHLGQAPITVGTLNGYKWKPAGLGQAGSGGQYGGGFQAGVDQIGTSQYTKPKTGPGSPLGPGVTGTGYPVTFNQGQSGSGQIGTGSGPYGFGQVGLGQPTGVLGGQLGLGQQNTGLGLPQTGSLGQTGGVAQNGGAGYSQLVKIKPWAVGQFTADAPHGGLVAGHSNYGQGGVADQKIKQYISTGPGMQQQLGTEEQQRQLRPVQTQPGVLGHLGQPDFGGAGYRPAGQTHSVPKFGIGQSSQLGQASVGHPTWIPSAQGVQYPAGTQSHHGLGYPTGANGYPPQKVKYSNGPQSASPSHQGTAPQQSVPSLHQGMLHPDGSHLSPQHASGYPFGSKMIVQQSVGQSAGSQVASQQGVGYPSGPQIISQQAATYPLGSKIPSQGYPASQSASQQKFSYPIGSQVANQQWINYPSGANIPQQQGSNYPTGSKPASQYGYPYFAGSQTHPAGSQFGSPQGISHTGGLQQGIRPDTASQYPFPHLAGYPTGPQQGMQAPSGSQAAYTKSSIPQHQFTGRAPIYEGQPGQLQGWQPAQYPAGVPLSGLPQGQMHGQKLGSSLNLQPPPPGFRYSLKPK